MKRLAALVIAGLALAVALSPARAQQYPDDQYIIIYSLMQQADSLNNAGQPRQALAQYVQVQDELRKFQKVFPDWNPKIVNFRLNYLAAKIAGVTAQLPVVPPGGTPTPVALPATPPTAPPVAPPTAPTGAVSGAVSPAAATGWEAQVNALREQVQKIQADNETLQARLKEALAAQPAAVDARELARAQAQIRSLMEENDLLNVSLSQGKAGMRAGTSGAGSDALKRARQALAEANKKLAGEMERANKLARENQALQARVQAFLAGPDAAEALRQENALLKKQIADWKSSATNLVENARLTSELAQARKQIVVLQSAAGVSSLEKAALESRVRQLQAATVKSAPPPDQTANEARIRALTEERNDLLAKLGQANQELYGRKKPDAAAQISELTDEVKVLRARLAVDEAQAVPYTPEELVLFRQPPPQPASPDAGKKSIKELPGGAAALVAEAQRNFSARQYDKAGDNYREILRRDENNGLALGNLAAIELEQNKLDDAEKHINQAVAQNPDDAYNLSILGYLKFRQEKYDDALNALSRAAKFDPQNPEIENTLGVTLSHKGMRGPAETALRKAIQLNPNYGAAHNNLAVIYVSQQPPLVGLARWHYQKALDAGQPRNPDLEKVLDERGAPVKAQ